MPIYEYRCGVCDERFELRTTFATADDARCPAGHAEVTRLLSTFALNRGPSRPPAPAPAGGGGGGCCGGACGCG